MVSTIISKWCEVDFVHPQYEYWRTSQRHQSTISTGEIKHTGKAEKVVSLCESAIEGWYMLVKIIYIWLDMSLFQGFQPLNIAKWPYFSASCYPLATGSPGIEPRTVEPNRTNRTVCEPLFSQTEPNRTVQRKATESLGLGLGEEPESRSSAAQLVQFSACQKSDYQSLNVELSLGPAPSSLGW